MMRAGMFGRDVATRARAAAPAGLRLVPVTGWLAMLPLLFFVAYLSATVALFAYGPWPWPVENGVKLYTFLAAAHVALVLGYVLAVRQRHVVVTRWIADPSMIVVFSALTTLALFVPTSLYRAGGFAVDIGQALVNPGAAYARSLLLRQEASPIVEYARIVAAPMTVLLVPVMAFYWRRLGIGVRALGLLAVFSTIVLFLASGTNKGIADIVLVVPWILFASHLAGITRFSRLTKALVGALSVIAFALFIVFFVTTQATRSGSSSAYGYLGTVGMSADYENPLVRTLPRPAQIGVLGLSLYLNTGYYGLYLCLEEPWEPTFGVGHSFFLTKQASRILDEPRIEQAAYPMRAQRDFGWDAVGLWSSIYPWIASDLSFPGTIVFVFAVGWATARSWLGMLRGNSPFAVAAFSQFVIMLFYFPGNNQVMQFGEGLAGFVGTLLLWRLTSGVSRVGQAVAVRAVAP